MSRTAANSDVRTYVPDAPGDARIVDFMKALAAFEARRDSDGPAIIEPDGTRIEVPVTMIEVLRQVAEALANGQGVTVAPMNAMLTTQEAADFLGISRPTLVRVLERGDIPMEKPGRHRLVQLSDLLAYQRRRREETKSALDELVRTSEESGLYERTDATPPATR